MSVVAGLGACLVMLTLCGVDVGGCPHPHHGYTHITGTVPLCYDPRMPRPISYKLSNGETRYYVRYRDARGRSTDRRGFQTKKDANKFIAQITVDKENGQLISTADRKMLVTELVEKHVGKKIGLSPTTIENRKSIGKKWVMPYWDGWTASKITKGDVNDFIEDLSEKGAGVDTIIKAHGILLAALNDAVDRGIIQRNPAAGARKPRAKQPKKQYLTHGEVAELAGEIDPRSRTLVGLLAYTGMRFGEASALRVESVDIKTRRISVRSSMTAVAGKLHEGPTKNKGERDVYFPAFLIEPLRALTEHRSLDEYVFTAERGGNVRLDDWRPRVFYPAIDRINEKRRMCAEQTGTRHHPFPDISPHDLRHTAASLAVSAGANVKALQRMLGHASASMTLDRYADLFEDDLVQVADALGDKAAERTDIALWMAK